LLQAEQSQQSWILSKPQVNQRAHHGAEGSLMNFTSDNSIGAHPKILSAIVASNEGALPSYGEDPYSKAAAQKLAKIFEHDDLAVFLVATGTAANALAIGALCPPWGAIFCHEDAHISEDECGAPEMFTAGAKIVGIPGKHGKLDAAGLKKALAGFPRGEIKQVQPEVLSLSQLTEAGTAYSCAEIAELAGIAHAAGLKVHMDGARFTNALLAQGCTPAQMSWRVGIDVLSFGATKNGALASEAVIFFDKAMAASFSFQRKRSGHTVSKGRLLGAQMTAYLEDGLWLELAAHANGKAKRLAEKLSALGGASGGVRLAWPADANELFVVLPKAMHERLMAAGAHYYTWSLRDGQDDLVKPDEVLIRLVTSFATSDDEIDAFLAAAGKNTP